MQHEQLKDFQDTKVVNNKSFGIQLSAIFFIIFLIRLYLNFFNILEVTLVSLSVFFITISFIKPSFLNRIRIIFSQLARILAKIINPIIMFILYLFIFIPFGIVLKFFSYDPLKEGMNKNLKSYWNFSKEFNKRYFKKQF